MERHFDSCKCFELCPVLHNINFASVAKCNISVKVIATVYRAIKMTFTGRLQSFDMPNELSIKFSRARPMC